MNESNIQQNNDKANDEIDIFEFCSRIWVAFKSFVVQIRNFIGSILIFLIRKSLWIVSFALLGMILGYVLYGVSRPYYVSSLEGNTGGVYDPIKKRYSGGVDNSVVIDHINKLDLVVSKPALLANYLDLNIEQAQEIRAIKAYYGIDVNKDMKPDFVDTKEIYSPNDTTQQRVPSVLYIQVSVYDENILPTLRKGLFQYINNNAYIQELYNIDRRQKKELLNEIEKIDSLQRARFRNDGEKEKGQLVVFGNNSELFYPDLLSLYERKQRLEKTLEISDEIITVIQDFTPLQQEENTVTHYIVRFGLLMAVLGVCCALLWQYRRKLWTMIREDSTK